MNLKKHPIVKIIPTVVKLLGQLYAINNNEIFSSFICTSEIPSLQPFFKLGVTRFSPIP